MSVLSLGLVLVAILAAVVLLFPVVFRVDFKLTESGFVADLFVFKKKLWNYTKLWKKEEEAEESAEPVKGSSPAADVTVMPAVETTVTQVAETPISEDEKTPDARAQETPVEKVKETPVAESTAEAKVEAKPAEPEKPAESESHTSHSTPHTPQPEPAESEQETPTEPEQEEKKSLTEREFWTLVLTPDIDERGYRYSKKILNSFINLFRVRFRDCYVEGIRMDYESMGYGAAVNAMMKGYPFLEDWDLRMDWTRDHDLQSAGRVEASLNLCRTFWFLTVSSVYGGIFAFVFWRRRAAVLKTGELPELGYVRKKILNWIVEE
ncbi:MAG: hypothetical protein IJ909_06005 [Fibrobacter sp.]|nr:hypothetical protein [Fibrobacter sp.]